MRDFQRSRLYKAEWSVRFDPRRIRHLEECQAYVDEMRSNKVLTQFRHLPKIEVLPGRTDAKATFNYDDSTMELPAWACTEFTIIHELAHFATPPGVADHGPEFAWLELQTIQNVFGKRHADELRGWFSYYKVKVGKTNSARKQRAPKHWTPPGQSGTV